MHAVEEPTEVQHAQVQEDQESGEDHADVADGIHHERFATGKHRRRSLVPEADQQVGAESDTGPTNDQPDQIAGQNEQQHRKHEEIHVGEESRVTGVFPHVADRVDMNHEADAGDHEDHQGGERVHIEVEGNVEIATLPPDEIRLIQGLCACQQLDQDGKRQDEPETYAAGADPAHYLPGQQAAEQRIDQETGERRQENQRRQRIHGRLLLHQIESVDIHLPAGSVDLHDDRNADHHLGRSDGDHQESKDNPIEGIEVAADGREGEVNRVEHEFDAHENNEGVAADQKADRAHRE